MTTDVDARARRTTGSTSSSVVDNRGRMTTVVFADRDGAAFGPLGRGRSGAPAVGGSGPREDADGLVAAGVRDACSSWAPGNRHRETLRKGIAGASRWSTSAARRAKRPATSCAGSSTGFDGETIVLRGDGRAEAAVGSSSASRREARADRRRRRRREARGFWRLLPGAIKKKELPREPASPNGPSTGSRGAAARDAAHAGRLRRVPPGRRPRRRRGRLAARRRGEGSEAPRREHGRRGVDRLRRRGTLRHGRPAADGHPARSLPSRSVVMGNLVVDAATGAESRLTDRSPSAESGASAGPARRRAPLPPVAAALAVAFLWSLVANAGTPRARRRGRERPVGRVAFTTFRFETAIPVLRDLPLLLSVLSGSSPCPA